MNRLDLDRLDLPALARVLQAACGRSVIGHAGRERLVRLLMHQLRSAPSEGTFVLEAMLERGLIVARERDGLTEWVLVAADE